jgi:S1-C subfamily serine protease
VPDDQRRRFDWQGRLLPRSVLGIAALLLSLALGSAFSGAVLYAYYDYRLDTNETRVDEYVDGFDERLDTAVEIIETEQEEARRAVRQELEPLREIAASGETIAELRERVRDSVWFVSTVGEDGSPSVGSAFVVFADAETSFLLTSFETVRAAARTPGPGIQIQKGDDRLDADLVNWEEDRDLALVSVRRGNLPRLAWAPDDDADIGERVFAVSGLGSTGATVSQGLVADVSSVGVQHDAAVGVHFQGGPLVNSNAEVVAVASRAYAPLGFRAEAVFFAPKVRSACERVLRCPDDSGASGAGG